MHNYVTCTMNTWLCVGCDILEFWMAVIGLIGEDPVMVSRDTERLRVACSQGVFLGVGGGSLAAPPHWGWNSAWLCLSHPCEPAKVITVKKK